MQPSIRILPCPGEGTRDGALCVLADSRSNMLQYQILFHPCIFSHCENTAHGYIYWPSCLCLKGSCRSIYFSETSSARQGNAQAEAMFVTNSILMGVHHIDGVMEKVLLRPVSPNVTLSVRAMLTNETNTLSSYALTFHSTLPPPLPPAHPPPAPPLPLSLQVNDFPRQAAGNRWSADCTPPFALGWGEGGGGGEQGDGERREGG